MIGIYIDMRFSKGNRYRRRLLSLEFIYKGVEAITVTLLPMTAIKWGNDVIWLQLAVKEANGVSVGSIAVRIYITE